ncbi:MAG: universal stress protein [Terrimesophilobacter sp.]
MVGTIVVGIEGTERSRVALRWSMERAAATGTEISLTHVIDDEWATVGSRILGGMRVDAERLLEREAEYARSLTSGVVVSTQLLHGNLMDELIVTSKNADLLAVGTHNTGFIYGRVFGSRSILLAAAAYSPVAIIPQSLLCGGRGVVVGVDDSDAGRAAICFAAAEAQRARQTLTLVRASGTPRLRAEQDEWQQQRDLYSDEHAKTILCKAETIAKSVDADSEIRVSRIRRPAAEALLDASATAALLVVGSSRREGANRMMLGSVSHDVLINLTGPTIVVHGAKAVSVS